MNKHFKVNIDLMDHFVKGDEVNSYDGSFKSDEFFLKGKTSIVLKPLKFQEYCPELSKMFPKKNVALKIYLKEPKICKKSQIQNIFAWSGLAPQVYATIRIFDSNQREYQAQVVEFINGDFCYDILKMRNLAGIMNTLVKANHIDHSEDFYPSNMIGGKWVDFGNFDWKDFEKYKIDVAVRYNNYAIWGNSSNAYQQCPALGINNGRGSMRKEMFELDKYDFFGKTVLDIGCSGGYFTNYAANKGARAIGVDLPSVIQATREAGNILNSNAEYYPFDLTKDKDFLDAIYNITGIKEFDYVFFLSMDQHIGFKNYLGDIAKTLFFESNGGMLPDEEFKIFDKELKNLFPSVEHKGVSTEGARRNLWVAQK